MLAKSKTKNNLRSLQWTQFLLFAPIQTVRRCAPSTLCCSGTMCCVPKHDMQWMINDITLPRDLSLINDFKNILSGN
jgi:hypothetical protein